MVHYKLSEPEDTFGQATTAVVDPPTAGININRTPVYNWVVQQLQNCNELSASQTILVLSDTRNPDDIDFFIYTTMRTLDRTRYSGPRNDKWFALFYPHQLIACHFTWIGVLLLEALSCFLPDADLVLWDGDATTGVLYETNHLLNLARNCMLPFLYEPVHYGLVSV